MTQMLLFDAPTASTSTAVMPAPADNAVAANTAAETVDEPKNIAAALDHESGLNHMGDLARLVLLRYDLVAKRRQQMAARRAARAK